ncbi:hypothetical protein BT96DRAFT_295323 [Gymnopus androsaceus JB14]|uniref:Uncharacterized protein n=1 Tax=Gymnopus androsaceus JB14 TaxID=1447944 RepID=A0A6A4I853_9AGAR|nr:hypothetical protein BT96DRAFT_295323 [Gymnopus androsaceus JB14]
MYIFPSICLSSIIILLQVQQLFMPRRDEREFFEHIIHFGSQDSLNNDNESKVIRAAMRTLAKICYKFGNVTTETKEAKFRQALDDLLEIALDYPFENEQLLGELLVEEPIFIKPTLVATSDAKVDTLFIFRIPNKFIGPLTDAGLDELRKSEPSTPVFDLFPKLKRLLISGEWTSTYLQHISLAILPGESNNASLTHKVGQLTMYLTTLQHQRRALGFPDRPMYGHSLGSDGLHILVSYWEEGNIVIPTESVASFPIAASDLRARAIAIFQSFQFLRRLVATMSEFFEQDLQRWDAQVGARSLSDPRNQWRDLIPPLPRFSSSSSSPRPPPSNMGPPGPPRSGPPSSSGSVPARLLVVNLYQDFVFLICLLREMAIRLVRRGYGQKGTLEVFLIGKDRRFPKN